MKKYRFLSVALVVCLGAALLSCGESSKERSQREAIDSLEMAGQKQKLDYEDLQSYLAVIADGLDSINVEEGEMMLTSGGVEGKAPNRQRMKQNLDQVRELLQRHRDRIAMLESKLGDSDVNSKRLKTIVASLRQQLDAKDAELAQLRADLEDNKKSVAQLTQRVHQMGEEQKAQAATIDEQKETISQQEQEIYTAYMKVGTKKELKELGLLSGGFLKKAKLDYSNVNKNLFQKVDIRTFSTMSLSKKAKILTPAPAGSYTLESNGATSTLTVLNAQSFWSNSKILIIQND